MRKIPFAALAAVPFLVLGALAQTTAPSKAGPPAIPGVRAAVQVTAVDLDVVATKDGKPVDDLAREEVRLTMNGKPVALDYFARIEAGTIHGPDLANASPDLILESLKNETGERFVPRQFLVFFDDEHLLPFERKPVIESLRDFVTRLAPSDWVSIVAYSSSARILVPYTNSKESLLDGLSRLEKLVPRGLIWDSQYRMTINDIRRTRYSQARQSMIQSWAEQVRARETGTLEELRRAVSALAGRSGKRAFIYVSRGLEMRPGQTLVQALGPSLLSQFDYSVFPQLQEVVDEANRAGVTIHAIDGRGLTVDADASESLPSPLSSFWVNQNLQEGLVIASSETGGTLVANRNIFPGSLDKIYEESSSYYSIGVTMTNVEEKKTSFDVKVTSTRPGVVMKTRQKYGLQTVEDAARDRMEMALVTPAARGDFTLSFGVGAPKKAGGFGRRLVPYSLQIPMSELTFLDDGDRKKAMAVIAISAIEDTGAKSGITPVKVPISIPASQFEKARKESFSFNGEMKTGTGNLRFVASVRDPETGRIAFGSVSVRVE